MRYVAARFLTDWTGIHRRDISIGLIVLNAAIGIAILFNPTIDFPHLDGIRMFLFFSAAYIGLAGILDKGYNNP